MSKAHRILAYLVAIFMCTLVTWSSSPLPTATASNRSVNEVLASVEQKLGFVLHSQQGLHQLQYAVTQTGRRLDGIELRMARLEHKLDSKNNGLSSAAHAVAAKMAMLEAQNGVQAQNLALKLDRTEANLLARLDERVTSVAARIESLEKFVRDLDDGEMANTSLADANATNMAPPTTQPCSQAQNVSEGESKEATSNPLEVPWWLSSLATNYSNQMVIVGEKRLRDLDLDIEIYTRKLMNTYHEVMKESRSIDVSLRQLHEQGNQTRLTVREAFRKLYQHTKPVSSLDEILRSLAKKVDELVSTVGTSFKSMLVAQSAFIASCHRVQEQEPVVETRIYHLIHKLVQEFGNKTKANKEELCSLRDAIDSNRKDVNRALQDLAWMVIAVGNQTVETLRQETVCNATPPQLSVFDPQLLANVSSQEQMEACPRQASKNETLTQLKEETFASTVQEQVEVAEKDTNESMGPKTTSQATSAFLDEQDEGSSSSATTTDRHVESVKAGGTDVLPERLPLEDDDYTAVGWTDPGTARNSSEAAMLKSDSNLSQETQAD